MPQTPSRDLLDGLADELSKLGMELCADATSLIALPQSKPRFLLRPALRLAGHYDFRPMGVIYDAVGGTFGLIEKLPPGMDVGALRTALDQAAAIRQLLLEEVDRGAGSAAGGERPLALQVELLILTETLTPESESALRKVLTDVARETGYVRLIGIGVLQPDKHGQFSLRALRRAFPWLLTATRQWFLRKDYASGEAWRKAGEPFELRLRDYRVAGTRRLQCDGMCNLQIVHGRNGSGKSALTEAIELLLSNGVQRVVEGGSTDYFGAVRHRPAGTDDTALRAMTAAEVSLWHGKPETAGGSGISSVLVKPDGIVRSGKAAAGLRAPSFRLDQTFMDRIVRNRPEQRIGIFLEAFSPSDVTLLPKLRANREAIQQGIAALPQHVAASAPTEETQLYPWLLQQFGWLRAGEEQVSQGTTPLAATAAARKAGLEAILPMPVEELKLLGQIDSALGDLVKVIESAATREDLVSALGRFDDTIQPLLRQLASVTDDLRAALKVFEELQSWTVTGRVELDGSFRTALDQWLDLRASRDLARRGRQIATTVAEASEHGWHAANPDVETVRALESDAVRQYLDNRVSEFSSELRKARSRVQTRAAGGSKKARPKVVREQERRQELTADEIASLNRAGKWLTTVGKIDRFGVIFNAALSRTDPVSLTQATIGIAGGLDPAIAEVRQVISACERLKSARASGGAGTSVRLQKLTELVEAVQNAGSLSSQLPNSFFAILSGNQSSVLEQLIAAFNELLALMTPARWTYRDIQLEIGESSADLTTADGARGDLLFNTAELNAWTLTLFLLLAPRLPNPLYLLVLDDPLQNMDDLTVITAARALSKLTQCYPPGWQILAMFHREDAVTRILEETQAVTYELPWMQPTSESTDDTIRRVHDVRKWPPDIQQFDGKLLAQIKPPVARVGL